jgi:hypothetical protein
MRELHIIPTLGAFVGENPNSKYIFFAENTNV